MSVEKNIRNIVIKKTDRWVYGSINDLDNLVFVKYVIEIQNLYTNNPT